MLTHLANRGDPQDEILAGVYDAICENVEALIKPSACPKDVVLIGGVSESARIRKHFESFCNTNGLHLMDSGDFGRRFVEAFGCALLAAKHGGDDIPDGDIESRAPSRHFDRIPPLAGFLSHVRKMPPIPCTGIRRGERVFLGFDIGSTGSKAVAIRSNDDGEADIPGAVCWEGYIRTDGNPVEAAKKLTAMFAKDGGGMAKVTGFGVTGSGREIVGSMLSTCFGADRVYILNEIAAHAEGARAIEPRVDTIFEIGGQDAKYIRLSGGRIVDAAMNEACSAGTGSFIEEQGRRLGNFNTPDELSDMALSAPYGVSLGQHCSVFMAQVIEDALSSGIPVAQVTAGIYDSVVLNYFYRVKGNRSVGDVVFCQGMPFSSPALAAAVVRQTGAEVVIPPNPGTIGAYGIARLARHSLAAAHAKSPGADLRIFLNSDLESRNTFICSSTKGCGGTGNKCRIDRIKVNVNGRALSFTWGGACSLWDGGTATHKLPDLSPDPFRERTELTESLVAKFAPRGLKAIAISDEFQLKTFFPFFASFLYELGFDIMYFRSAGADDLRRGLEGANVRFCAPMQHFHGLAARQAASHADRIFWPMMRSGRFSANEQYAAICPVVQSSPDVLFHDMRISTPDRVVSPVIDLGPGNIRSSEFAGSCRKLASSLGADDKFDAAFGAASKVQDEFDAALMQIGRRAIAFASSKDIDVIVVLGRNYTIHNRALNSNVPAILRSQGAMAIPVDCYPVPDDIPPYSDVYWSYGQINLRAATHIRRTPRHYAVWCSNYGCGPDSFNLHFFQFIMQGKPYVVIETDGHSGDAGTKTRIESFLHCIEEYASSPAVSSSPQDLHALETANTPLSEARRTGATVLIPHMGDNAEIIVAGMRNLGINCKILPVPTRSTLMAGRRHTSGKECLPMLITLGSLLEYVESAPKDERIVFFMPRSNGPCRLGCYNLLDKIVLRQMGLDDRVSIWSLTDTDYSVGMPKETFVRIYTAFLACDVLMAALYDVRPTASDPAMANAIYRESLDEIERILETAPRAKIWQAYVAREILGGTFFGIADVVRRAAARFASIKTARRVPTVCLTGEIYVRNDPFANEYIIDALESRGIRVLFAHFSEWIEYADVINREILCTSNSVQDVIISNFMRFMFRAIHRPMARALNWPSRHSVHDILRTASGYLRPELVGEEILTIGTPLLAAQKGEVQGAVSVGPLECMPSKIAESQFYHVAENEGLITLSLSLNGDPMPDSVLDDFCFEVRRRFEATMG